MAPHKKRLPAAVLKQAQAEAAAQATVKAPERKPAPVAKPPSKNAVREKLVAHLKRLHPMD